MKTQNLLSSLLATPCLICGEAPARSTGMCTPCTHDLPWQAPGCQYCGVDLRNSTGLRTTCSRCFHKPPAFDRCRAVFAYEAPVANLIRRLKDEAGFAEFRALSDCLNQHFVNFYEDMAEPLPELLLPVPLHSSRLRQRGFNQAQLLAQRLSRRTGIAMLGNNCQRHRGLHAQRGLNAEQRFANMHLVFSANARTALTRGRRIAIIDDVVTTTATAQAMSAVMREQAAKQIDVWALARSNHQPES